MTELLDLKKSRVVLISTDGLVYEDGLDIVSMSTSFRIQAIPTCTCAIAAGNRLNDSSYNPDTVIQGIVDAFNSATLYIHISMDFLVGSTGSTVSVDIFSGVVTALTTTNSMYASGRSSRNLVVSAHHVFVDLYTIGAGGMVYASPGAIKEAHGNLFKLIEDTKPGNMMTSARTMNQSIVPQVVNKVCPNSVTTPPEPVVSEFYYLFSDMSKESALVDPNGFAPYISSYLKGSARLNVASDNARIAVEKRLNTVWDSMYKSTAGEVIMSICTSPQMGLIVAPRSTESFTLIPDVGASFYTSNTANIPTLSKSRIIAIAYNNSDNPAPDPDGVLVTTSGSIFYDEPNGADPRAGLVQGMYPTNTSSTDRIRWFYTQAPSWFSDVLYRTLGSAPKNPQPVTPKELTDMCNAYAKNIFYRLRYKSSSCTVEVDPKCINAYEALGSVCRIQTADNTYLAGRLDSYGLKVSMSAEGRSIINVSLTFTYIHPYASSNVVDPSDSIYSIKDEDKDILKVFPDITTTGSTPSADNVETPSSATAGSTDNGDTGSNTGVSGEDPGIAGLSLKQSSDGSNQGIAEGIFLATKWDLLSDGIDKFGTPGISKPPIVQEPTQTESDGTWRKGFYGIMVKE